MKIKRQVQISKIKVMAKDQGTYGIIRVTNKIGVLNMGLVIPPAGDSFVGGVHFIETEIDKDLRQTDRPSLQNAREMLISHFLLQTGLTY